LGNISGLQQKLQSFCLAQKDFNIVLSGAACRGEQMLYLNVLPGMINMVREQLVNYLKIPPGASLYRPHLTLMRSSAMPGIDMPRMLTDAKNVFAGPYQFAVSAFEVYTRGGDGLFEPSASIQFTGR
jgi:hypothetical protein